ncbi:class I SAM-dependent methyltransferase [Spirillospora sp. CA-294931]|uniref:class I SAM-dependent methyltransferase n=1 Tax=Spirillospora sp. CA-294931 TaxID=3240042 RepID=UPI003D8DF001
MGDIPAVVRAVYGSDDLSSAPAFSGGFINFGYWDGISLDRPLGTDDRVRSERNLYLRVLRELRTEGDVLEVGCGLGVGCALALRESGLASVTGMDIHPDQVERARRANAEEPGRLRFVRGAAESMPFEDAAFDAVYTVEAAQHFRDLAGFARESARVLRPGGRLVITSFFLPDARDGVAELLAERLDSFASGLDVPHPLPALTGELTAAGLARVSAESIGESVWPGLDRFLAELDQPVQWPRNFLVSYRDGLLDYYVITAEKPG